MTMSLESSHTQLRTRCRDLSQAATELVTIVHEDRPPGSEVAVIDRLVEVVSELQAAAIRATEELDAVADPRALPGRLARIDDAVAECRTTYWCDLASHRPLAAMRRAAHEHGREWRTWQRSIELSLARCELALDGAGTAVRAAWQEVGELLTHYTHAGVTGPWPETTNTEVSTSTRRQS
jgi:hypothetical protein